MVWADRLQKGRIPDESMTFTAYDGCGKPLYKVKFSNLSVADWTASFDYSNSEISTTDVKINFGIIHRELLACPDQFKRYQWVIMVDEQEYPLYNEVRPEITIEEFAVNHLNAKRFLPDKAEWNELKIIGPDELGGKFLKGNSFDVGAPTVQMSTVFRV